MQYKSSSVYMFGKWILLHFVIYLFDKLLRILIGNKNSKKKETYYLIWYLYFQSLCLRGYIFVNCYFRRKYFIIRCLVYIILRYSNMVLWLHTWYFCGRAHKETFIACNIAYTQEKNGLHLKICTLFANNFLFGIL